MKIGIQTWGSEGDIRPFAALATGLVKDGHDVTLVATDGADRNYQPLAEAHGFKLRMVATPVVRDAMEVDLILDTLIKAGSPVRQSRIIVEKLFEPALNEMSRAAFALVDDSDLLIRHFFLYPAAIAAEKAGIPEISVMLAHNCLPSRDLVPPGFPSPGRWFNPLAWRICQMVVNRMFLADVNQQRRILDLAPQKDVMTESWVSRRLNLIAVSPTLCPRPGDWPDHHRVCGFLDFPAESRESLSDALDDFLSSGPAPVYFTFGSLLPKSSEALRDVITVWKTAVQQAGCRAIFQIPANTLTDITLGDDVYLVERAPHALVFPRCSLVVHHGGAGTTQSALLAGCPSVIVAHVADQFFWGEELHRLGVAGKPLVRRKLHPDNLTMAILGLLSNQTVAARAQAMGESIGCENGVATAVGTIKNAIAPLM
jgi:UDP:flavonoid glycosyltransferase YjiC (YdhE family)